MITMTTSSSVSLCYRKPHYSLLMIVAVLCVSIHNAESFYVPLSALRRTRRQQASRAQRWALLSQISSSSNDGSPKPFFAMESDKGAMNADNENDIAGDLELLTRAAETKQEDPGAVIEALLDLEKKTRLAAREDPAVAEKMLDSLDGDWRLVFTTGTIDTEKKFGRINYFPVKAVQSFRTKNGDPMSIENGIYFGDWAAAKFSGAMEFDMKRRRLEFDFDRVALLNGLFDIRIKPNQAAEIGASTGLGSKSNIKNAERGKKAFFNWISADDNIATARGGGGGLALWKRVG